MSGPSSWYRRVDPVLWFVLAFFLISCAYEFGRVLHLRPQPHHLWRQTDCIALAWNYYDTTWNLFEPALHNQFADHHASGKSAGEFPILYWIVGMLWRITGPSEFLYRLIEFLIHFAGTLALFSTIRRITGSAYWAGCCALLFYASPVIVYFGIGFLTDVPAFDLALVGWWYMTRYAMERARKHWAWAVFFFSLATALKVTAGMSLVALSGILFFTTLFRRRLGARWSPFAGSRFEWAALACGLAGIFSWYIYAAHYNDLHGAKYTFNDLWPIWIMTPVAREWAWTIGSDIIVFQVFDTSIWILCGIAATALVVNARKVGWQVLFLNGALLAGSVLYTLFWFNALDNHDYYFINPMITLAALLVSFLWMLRRLYPDLLEARWSRWAMGVLLVFNVAYTAQNMRMRYDTSGALTSRKLWPLYHEEELRYWNGLTYWGMDDLVTIEPRLRELGVRKEDKVIFLDDGAINSSLVLMGNRGWTAFGIDLMAPGAIDELIRAGARYLMFTRSEWLTDQRLTRFLTRPVGQFGNVRIFDLRQGGPPPVVRTVLDQAHGTPLTLKHRFDTIPCDGPGDGWCFANGEYPFEIDGLPTYGEAVRFATVEVRGSVHWESDPGEAVQFMLGEDDDTHQLAISGGRIPEGPFDLKFTVPARPTGVRNKLFIANRSGRHFTIRDLRIEVATYAQEAQGADAAP